MHIFTERGWRPLQTKPMNKLVEAPPRYRGPLPSFESEAYTNKLAAEHVEWQKRRAERLEG